MLCASHIPHSWQENAKRGTRREQCPRAPTGGDRSKVNFQQKFLRKFASSLQNRQNCSDHPSLLLNGSNHTKRPSVIHTLLILLYVNFFNTSSETAPASEWLCWVCGSLSKRLVDKPAVTSLSEALRLKIYIYTLDFLTYWQNELQTHVLRKLIKFVFGIYTVKSFIVTEQHQSVYHWQHILI